MKTTNLHLLSGKSYKFCDTPATPISIKFNPEAGTYTVSDATQSVTVPVARIDRISSFDSVKLGKMEK